MQTTIGIGIAGYGVVGAGLAALLQQVNTPVQIRKICIRHPHKTRNLSETLFTQDVAELITDSSIHVIVELTDDADFAWALLRQSVRAGKPFITANKKMVAAHLEEIIALQQQYGVPVLYEAACCAAIPVLRTLDTYYSHLPLHSLAAIVNGSTNFILTAMDQQSLPFKAALLQAQQQGFAESNPALDTQGFDAVNKLSILLLHAFGIATSPANLLFHGIESITEQDIEQARQQGFCIKLQAQIRRLDGNKIAAFVLPTLVAAAEELGSTADEWNLVQLGIAPHEQQFLKGKGAGALPTATAVLSDLLAAAKGDCYGYGKYQAAKSETLTREFYLRVKISADALHKINSNLFEWVEESHRGQGHCWVTGVVNAENLLASDWWKKEGISLLLCNNPVVENVAYRSISRRSLQLAGVA